MQLELPAEGAGSPSHHSQGWEWESLLSDEHLSPNSPAVPCQLHQGTLLSVWELNRILDSGSRFPHSAPLAHLQKGNNFPTLLNFSRILAK